VAVGISAILSPCSILAQAEKIDGVEGYYDPSPLSDYRTRYNLFMLTVLFTGLVAIVIPFVIR
jgi:hypothetical protein